MKLQEILLPFGLAVLTIWSLSYFWGPKTVEDTALIRPGQEFNVMRSAQMCFPTNTEMDFYDQHLEQKSWTTTEVKGYHTDMMFSNGGAALTQISFVRDLAGVQGIITTLQSPMEHEHGKGALLVALQDMTPYNFVLVSQIQKEDAQHLVYESSTKHAKITKEFIVSSKKYELGLVITVEPLVKDAVLQPRIFIPGPFMTEIVDQEKVSGIVFNERESLKKLAPDATVDVAWASPKIVGVEDRYFIAALVSDKDNFTQRAYFKRNEGNRLTAILEGPKVTEKTTWNMSFYYGPKEAAQLYAVDKRLEDVMDYGWLAPISKFLIFLLTFIYSYIGNYGWAIIILTVSMRILLLPFVQKGKRNMRRSSELAQKLKHLEVKYKDDQEAFQQARMELYKKYGMSPVSGCLPLLIQLPIFIGLNFALRNSIELYKAPFMLWIKDLSARDPYYVLPALIGISFFMAMSATSKDPRHKIAMFIAAMVIAGVTANLSAGLGLFIVVSSFLGVIENRLTQGASAA